LEVSRITTGRIHLRRDRIVLQGVVERAIECCRPSIEKKGHKLAVSLDEHPIWIEADAARVEQIVVNLLSNAVKYTPEGGQIWLTVTTEGRDAVLRVRDTGIGISPELLPRVFDLFTQSERALDRSDGGLGIGLALVERLVQMQGGTVHATSRVGQGSEFVVRLPIASKPASQQSPTTPKTDEAAGPSLRILVVDDNVDAATTLAVLLKSSGHDVRAVHDGVAALQEAKVYRPNLILLDIGLPGMNGFEVAKKVRDELQLGKVVLV
jgi:two-component sensor histidine kinase